MRLRAVVRPQPDTFQALTLAYAVGTVLMVRLLLQLTGYPKIGGSTLHIAHVLWGGLMMLIAGAISLMFYGRDARRLSAIVLGIGFGLFIDEVGKFITQDNNYFFRPAAALIYICFVLLFLIYQGLRHISPLTDRALMCRAAEELEEVVRGDFGPREKASVLGALERVIASPSHYGDLARELHEVIRRQQPVPEHLPNRLTQRLAAARDCIISRPEYRRWLFRLLTAVTILGLLRLAFQALVVLGVVFGPRLAVGTYLAKGVQMQQSELTASILQAFWSLIASLFLLRGIWTLHRNVRSGLHFLSRGMMIVILFVEVFTFYFDQFNATFDVLAYLVFLTLAQTLLSGSAVSHRPAAVPAGPDMVGELVVSAPPEAPP